MAFCDFTSVKWTVKSSFMVTNFYKLIEMSAGHYTSWIKIKKSPDSEDGDPSDSAVSGWQLGWAGSHPGERSRVPRGSLAHSSPRPPRPELRPWSCSTRRDWGPRLSTAGRLYLPWQPSTQTSSVFLLRGCRIVAAAPTSPRTCPPRRRRRWCPWGPGLAEWLGLEERLEHCNRSS
jgi:hypothetical protein